jgi:hypothetical protein
MSISNHIDIDDAFFSSMLHLIPLQYLQNNNNTETSDPSTSTKSTNIIPKQPHNNKFKPISNKLILEKKNELNVEEPQPTVSTLAGGEGALTVAELNAKLAKRLEENRKKSGIPGARAERDKLLPPEAFQDRKRPLPSSTIIKGEVNNNNNNRNSNTNTNNKRRKEDQEPTSNQKIEMVSSPKKLPTTTTIKNDLNHTTTNNHNNNNNVSYVLAPTSTTKQNNSILLPTLSSISSSSINKTTNPNTKSVFNIKKLIKKAQDGQARMNELKALGETEKVDEILWDKVQRKASGQKILDDPKLLKKKLKRLERQKEKSKEERKKRFHDQERSKDARQETRDTNIAERKKAKLDRKIASKGIITQSSSSSTTNNNSTSTGNKRSRWGFESSGGTLNSKKNKS